MRQVLVFIFSLGFVPALLAVMHPPVYVGSVSSPVIEKSVEDSPKYLFTARVEEGWTVPALQMFTRAGNESELVVNNIKVKRRLLKAAKEPLVTIEQFRLTERDEVLISRTPCYISDIIAYSVSGRIIAYEVQGVVAVKAPDGRVERGGGVLHVFYYDETGAGKFQTRVVGAELKRVPSWAIGG